MRILSYSYVVAMIITLFQSDLASATLKNDSVRKTFERNNSASCDTSRKTNLPLVESVSNIISVLQDAPQSPTLIEKVKRLGPGLGREITLSINEVKILLDHGKFALISAGINPEIDLDKILSENQIKSRYKNLENDLKDGGYAYTKIVGHYGAREDSFLVMAHEINKEEIVFLGNKYNQDSVIHCDKGKNELIFTTGNNQGKIHAGKGWTPVQAPVDMFSEIKTSDGHFNFMLNFDFEKFALLFLKELLIALML